MNELVILTSSGNIPIDIDELFQNIYGDLVVLHNDKHIKLKTLIETDYTLADMEEE